MYILKTWAEMRGMYGERTLMDYFKGSPRNIPPERIIEFTNSGITVDDGQYRDSRDIHIIYQGRSIPITGVFFRKLKPEELFACVVDSYDGVEAGSIIIQDGIGHKVDLITHDMNKNVSFKCGNKTIKYDENLSLITSKKIEKYL